jgi:hypothetical protein
MAPIPSIVRSKDESVFLNVCVPVSSASATIWLIGLVAKSDIKTSKEMKYQNYSAAFLADKLFQMK